MRAHTIEQLLETKEQQTFDRKSVRIDAKGLAVVVTAIGIIAYWGPTYR